MASVLVPDDGVRYLGITANPRGGRTAAQEQTYVDGQISPDSYQVIRRYHGWTNDLIDGYEATIAPPRILWPYWFLANASTTYATYADVLDGSQDTVINRNADACIAYGYPMFLTFHMEPENDTATVGSAAQFINAWRYIHEMFDLRGVTNVSWALVLEAATYDAGTADTWYPGDAYVDWIAADGYNWYTYHSAPWKLLTDVFNGFRGYAAAKGKPAAIGEYATVPDPADSTRKGHWYDDALATLKTSPWNGVKCACYFNSQPFPTSPPWWLDDDATGASPVTYPLAHWKTLTADSTWNVRTPSTWYVKTTGSDAAAGTSTGTAFATLNHAFSVAQPGDSIYLMDAATPGTAIYAEDVNVASSGGTTAAPVYVQGCDSTGTPLPDDFWNRVGRPVWKGRHWLQSGFQHVRFRSIIFDGRLVTSPTSSPNDPGLILDAQDVHWDYCSFTNHNVVDPVGRVMVKENSGSDLHWNSSWFYEIGNMTNRTNTNQGPGGADTGFFQHAFYGGPLTTSSMIDCLFVHVAGRGLQFYGGVVNGFQTLRCGFIDCGTPAIIDSHSTNNTFQECLFDGSLILGGVASGSGGGGPGTGNSVSSSFFHGITGGAVGSGIASTNNTTGGSAPQYVDAANYDYHLTALSPGLGTGPRHIQLVAGTVPQVGVIFFENKGRAAVLSGAPYFKTVDSTYRSFTNYEGTSKPSLPDYEAYVAGNYAPNTAAGGSGGVFGGAVAGKDGAGTWSVGYWGNHQNLLDQITAKGLIWKTYEEDVTGLYNKWTIAGNRPAGNFYLSRHCPANFFTTTMAPGVSHGRGRYDFDELTHDITNASFPDFFMITPNSVNDGHDSGLGPADTWLQNNLANILAAMHPDGLLIITFDNVPVADTTSPVTGTGVIYNVIAGQGITHSSDGTYYTHFSMLKGIQNLFGLTNFTTGVDSHYTSATAINLGTGTPDTQAPTTPSVALAVLGASSIRVTMTGSTDNVAVTGYEVSRSPHSAATWTIVAPDTTTPYTDSGLASSTQYDYRVRALDAAQNFSAYSTTQTATTSAGGSGNTTVDVSGTITGTIPAIRINGTRTHVGDPAEGLLINMRMVNAIFDDLDATTLPQFAYPSGAGGGTYSASRQTNEFVAQIPTYRAKGVDAVSIALQGGRPVITSADPQPWDDTPWTTAGAIPTTGTRANYWSRLDSVLNTLDQNGIVCILQLFYFGQVDRLTNDAARNAAMDATVDWLLARPYRGIMFNLANEVYFGGTAGNTVWAGTMFDNDTGINAALDRVRARLVAGGWTNPLVGITFGSGANDLPSNSQCAHLDWVGLQDNSWTTSNNRVSARATTIRGRANYISTPFPILVVEDQSIESLGATGVGAHDEAVTAHVSTGFYAKGAVNADYKTGFQTVPSAWGLNNGFGGVTGTPDATKKLFTDWIATVTSTTPVDITKPSTPTNLAATAVSTSQINTSWTASTDDVGVTNYKVYRDSGNGSGFVVRTTLGNVTSYSDTGLAQNTFYQYKISALDAAGNESPLSNSSGATTQSTGGTDTINDTFARNTSNAWGTSTDGHPWIVDQGVASQFNVVSGTGGTITQVAGDAPIVAVKDVSQQDYDVTFLYKFSALPTAGTQNITLGVRYQDPQNYTRFTISQSVGGNAQLGVDRQIANANTSLGTKDTGAPQAINTLYKARLRAFGSTVQGKVWKASLAEPATWDITGTDNTAPIIAGGACVRAQATAAWTGGATYTVTSFIGAPSVSDPGGGGGFAGLPQTGLGTVHLAQSMHGTSDIVLSSDSQAASLATLVDFIIGKTNKYNGHESAMVAANPDIALGLYFNGNSIDTADGRPESWYAHTAASGNSTNRLLGGNGADLIQEPEITSPSFGGSAGPNPFHAQEIKTALGSTYGLFYMDSMTRWNFDGGASGGPPVHPGTSTAWTWAQWRDQNLVSLIDAVKAANPNAACEINALSDGSTFGGDIPLAYTQHADICQAEAFIGSESIAVTTYPNDADWKAAAQMVVDMNGGGVAVHARIGASSGSVGDTNARRVYAAATCLICDRGGFWIDPRLPNADNLQEVQNPIWQVDVGPPLETPTTITNLTTSGAVHISAGTKTYARRFQNGLAVLVTDDSGSRTLTLDYADYTDAITGTPVGGSTMAVQPNTGYILTRTGGGGGGGGGGGTTVTDDSGNGLSGTLMAGTSGNLPNGVQGPRGTDRGLFFDGTGGRVEIPDTTGVLNAVNWTLAAWVKLTLNPGDTDPAHQRYEILEKAGAYWINIRYDTTPPYKVRTGSFFGGLQQGFDFIDSANPITPGQWTHVTGTYDGTNLSVWINGVLSASKAKTGDSGGGTGEPLTMGAKHRYNGGELLEAFMHGSISSAWIFDHALTSAEIQTVMNATLPIWTDKNLTFTPGAGDVGSLLRAKQSATNSLGTASAVGTPSAPITAAPGSSPQNTSAPQLSDTTPAEGQVITSVQGTWTGDPTPTISDTVQVSTSPAGPWQNATPPNQAYTIPSDGSKVGQFLSIQEVASNSLGTATKRSTVSAAITASGTGPPTNTVLPVLSPNSVQAGVAITSSEGTWTNVGANDVAQYSFEEQDPANPGVVVVQQFGSSNQYTPSTTDVQIRSVVQHRNASGSTNARSAWAQPAGNWVIQPIFPQPNSIVTNAIVDTSWQLAGVIAQGQAFYVRGDGGPWIRAVDTGGGVLTATVTLIGGDGLHLIEGDVH